MKVLIENRNTRLDEALVDDCPVGRIVEGLDRSTTLEIRELETFKAGHARGSGTMTSTERERHKNGK